MGLLDDLLGHLAARRPEGRPRAATARPKAAGVVAPSETSATTSESVVSTFIAPATSLSAEWKQAA